MEAGLSDENPLKGAGVRRWSVIVVIAGSLAFMTACSWLGIGVATSRNCSRQVAAEYPSPSNVRKAVVYNYSCDGQPEMSYAEILPADGPKFTPSIFNLSKSTAQEGLFQWPNLDLTWKSDSELWITYPAGYRLGV